MGQRPSPPAPAQSRREWLLAPFRGRTLYALLLLSGILVAGLYQTGATSRWDLGDPGTSVYLVDFYGVEHAGALGFRWAAPRAGMRVPGVGSYPGVLHLTLNGDPWGGPARVVSVQVGDDPPVALPLDSGWHEYRVPFAAPAAWPGDLVIRLKEPELQIPPAERAGQDTRRLGVPVAAIAVQPAPGPIMPPLPVLGGTLLAIGLLCVVAIWLGLPAGAAAAGGALLALAWASLLGGARPAAILAFPGLLLSLLLALGLGLALRFALGVLFQHGGVQMRPAEGAWLVAFFVLSMVAKASGLLDPMFVTLDHYARLHRLMEFGADPVGFLQHFLDPVHGETYAGQLGLSAVVPYSPLFYVALDPINWLVPDLDTRLRAINLVCSALEASNGFFLFYALKRTWGDGLAGVWAAALFVAFPLSNLLFSDGGYPGIFATWLLVLFIAALAWVYPMLQRGRWPWGPGLVLTILLALALLAHTANALLLGTTVGVFVLLVVWGDRGRLAAVAGVAGAGLLLAFLSFYQFSAAQVLGDLLPQVITRLQSAGGVGKNPGKLGAPLLSGFGPQIAAHFQTWPVLVGGLALIPALRGRLDRGAQTVAGLRPRTGLGLWLAATAATFGLFSLLDTWINLLQKHMIYAMPALALLDGLALAGLWRRGRPGQALCLVLWTALYLATLSGWVARVVAYVLPPGSG